MNNFWKQFVRNKITSSAAVAVAGTLVPDLGPVVDTIFRQPPQTKADWVQIALKSALIVGLASAKDYNISGAPGKVQEPPQPPPPAGH